MATKAEEISITFADDSMRELDPDEASSIYAQLKSQQSKFMSDLVIDKVYVRKELAAKLGPLKPIDLTRYVGKLWGRVVHPQSPFDKFSRTGKKLAKVTRQNPDSIRLSARNLLEKHEDFDTMYQKGVGDTTRDHFDIIVKAIQRDLGLSTG